VANLEIEDDHDVGYKRPLLVRIIALLSISAGILLILAGILSVGVFTTVSTSPMGKILPVGSFQVLSYIILASGIDTALQGWGLLKMKPWAWIMVTFFLLSSILLSAHIYTSNATATNFDLSVMIADIFIAGLLLAYFVKKREYFNLDTLSARTTLMIIGGLAIYSIILMAATDIEGTAIKQWVQNLQGLHSV